MHDIRVRQSTNLLQFCMHVTNFYITIHRCLCQIYLNRNKFDTYVSSYPQLQFHDLIFSRDFFFHCEHFEMVFCDYIYWMQPFVIVIIEDASVNTSFKFSFNSHLSMLKCAWHNLVPICRQNDLKHLWRVDWTACSCSHGRFIFLFTQALKRNSLWICWLPVWRSPMIKINWGIHY